MDVFAWLTDTNKSFVFAAVAVAALASSVFLGCSSSPTPADASIEKPDSVSVGQRYLISTCSESRVKNSKWVAREKQIGDVTIDRGDIVAIEPADAGG
jgi:hypothetical protein